MKRVYIIICLFSFIFGSLGCENVSLSLTVENGKISCKEIYRDNVTKAIAFSKIVYDTDSDSGYIVDKQGNIETLKGDCKITN